MKKVLAMSSLAVLLGVSNSADAMKGFLARQAAQQGGQPLQSAPQNENQNSGQGDLSRSTRRVQSEQNKDGQNLADQNEEGDEGQNDSSHNSQRHRRHHSSRSASNNDNDDQQSANSNKKGSSSKRPSRNQDNSSFSLSQGHAQNSPQKQDSKKAQGAKDSRQFQQPPRKTDDQQFSRSQQLAASKSTKKGVDETISKSGNQTRPIPQNSSNNQNDYDKDYYSDDENSKQQQPQFQMPSSVEISQFRNMTSALARQKSLIGGKLKVIEDNNKDVRNRLKAIDNLLKQIGKGKDSLDKNASLFNQALNDVRDTLKELKDEAENINQSILDIQKSKETLQNWSNVLQELRMNVSNTDAKLSEELGKLTSLTEKIKQDDLVNRARDLISESGSLTEFVNGKRSEVESILQCFDEKVKEISGLLDEAGKVKQDIDGLRQILTPAETKDHQNEANDPNSQENAATGNALNQENENFQVEEDTNENQYQELVLATEEEDLFEINIDLDDPSSITGDQQPWVLNGKEEEQNQRPVKKHKGHGKNVPSDSGEEDEEAEA